MLYCFVDADQLYDLKEYKLPVFRYISGTAVSQIAVIIFRPERRSMLLARYTDYKTIGTVDLKDKKYAEKAASGEKFTEKEVQTMKLALLKKIRLKVAPTDTILFESIKQVSSSAKGLLDFYPDYLLDGYTVRFMMEPYLDSLVYQAVINLLNTDIVAGFLKGQIEAVYKSLKMNDHILLASKESYIVKPGDSKKRRDEIRNYVIRNYHEAFAGYSNNRQVADMLVQEYCFKSMSPKTVGRAVSEMLAETGRDAQ